MYISPTAPRAAVSLSPSSTYILVPPHNSSIPTTPPLHPSSSLYFTQLPPASLYPYTPYTRSRTSSGSFSHNCPSTAGSSSHTTSFTFFNPHGNSCAIRSSWLPVVHHSVTPSSRSKFASLRGAVVSFPMLTAHPPLANVRNTSRLPA